MRRELAVVGGVGTIGGCGLSVALLGLGVPFLLAAVLAGIAVGVLLYAWARWRLDGAEARARALEARGSELRHDLRGALTPALLLSDRLLKSGDPAIQRAGRTVVVSIERAMALLAEDRGETEAKTAATPPADPAPATRRRAAESAGPAR